MKHVQKCLAARAQLLTDPDPEFENAEDVDNDDDDGLELEHNECDEPGDVIDRQLATTSTRGKKTKKRDHTVHIYIFTYMYIIIYFHSFFI